MSYIDVMKAELEKAQSTVLHTTRISRDQYSELMFRHGSLFAEQFSRRFLDKNDVLQKLLQDKTYGYWDWWKTKWQMDDQAMISTNALGEVSYEQMKQCMIGDEMFEDELLHLINDLI